MKKIYCILFAFKILIISAQTYTNNWYFGNSGVSFISGSPISLANSSMSTGEGCASISDSNGNLLFYTDGVSIYNKNHVIMANGNGLMGSSVSAQSAIIVPQPGNPNLYYVFTVDDWMSTNSPVAYSIVDVSLNAGSGSVTAVKNVTLNIHARESITATRHCNGIDYWITFWDKSTAEFNTYSLTSSGLSSVPLLSSANTFTYGSGNRFGSLRFSANGKKLAFSLGAITTNTLLTTLEIYDFDNSTGVISNPQTIETHNNAFYAYGCEFSPNSNLLYATAYNQSFVYQYDLNAGSTALIKASRLNIANGTTIKSNLQLGPDGKIYTASGSFLGAINNPNTLGIGCNFVSSAVSLSFLFRIEFA